MSDEIEVLKNRIDDNGLELDGQRPSSSKNDFKNLAIVMMKNRGCHIGLMIIVFGIVLMAQGQILLGILIIIIGIQFIF